MRFARSALLRSQWLSVVLGCSRCEPLPFLTHSHPHAALCPRRRGGRHMPLILNKTKRKMQAGEVALGFGVHHLRSAAAPTLAAASGHDWMFLDNEHGSFSVNEIAQLCIASLPTGVTPLVRVCANAIDEATRALDNGALGIVMPHVDTAKEARRIAEAFRYPPLGRRSWGGPPAV